MNERLTLQIDTKTTGSAEVQALSDALNKVVSISQKAGKSGSEFSSFPAAIKSYVQDPLGAAEHSLTSFASGFGVVGVAAASGITALSLFAVASISATRELADFGVSIENLSLKLGFSTKEVSQFSFAARAVGADIGVFETGMRKLSQGLADGGEEGRKARGALTDLGVSTRTLTGDIRPTAEIFQQIAESISQIESPAKRNAEVVKIFGRAGIELIPVLEHLNENLARAKELGLGLSDEQLKKFLEYKKQIEEVDTAWTRAKRHFAEGIAGSFFIKIEGAGAALLEMLAGTGQGSRPGGAPTPKAPGGPKLDAFAAMEFALGGVQFQDPHALAVSEGSTFAQSFQSGRLRTPEGISARIATLEGEINNLVTGISPGSGAGIDVLRNDASSVAAKQREVDNLKAQLKNIGELRSAVENAPKRTAEALGSESGPIAKTFAPLDLLRAQHPGMSAADQSALMTQGTAQVAPELHKLIEEAGKLPLLISDFGLEYQSKRYAGKDFQSVDTSGLTGGLSNTDLAGRAQYQHLRNETADQGQHSAFDFNEPKLEASERMLRSVLGELKEYISLSDELTKRSGQEGIEKIQRDSDFQGRRIGINPNLNEGQKIVQMHALELDTARLRYAEELKTAEALSLEKGRAEAIHLAELHNEVELQRVREDNLLRIAELEARRIEAFKSEVGSIFDALASGQGLSNVLKSNVLSIGRTVTENAAKEFLLPALQKATPHFGKLFEGTPFGPDPLKSATDLNTTATLANTAAIAGMTGLKTLAGSPSSGGGGLVSGLGSDGLPVRGTNTSLFPSAFSNFGSGAGSVLSGYGLSVATDPGFNAATRIGAGAGLAGAGLAGGYGIYSGIKQGGAGGDLKAAGSAAGLAGGIVSNVSKLLNVASPLLSAIPVVGSIAAMALPLLGGLFNGPQRRANEINQELESNKYHAPTALNVTQSSGGTFASFDARGNIRTSNFSPFPNVTNPSSWEQTHGLFGGPPTWYDVPGRTNSQYGAPVQAAPVVQHIYQAGSIQTMDAQSFHDFAHKNAHSIGDAAATALQNSHARLANAVQYVAGH